MQAPATGGDVTLLSYLFGSQRLLLTAIGIYLYFSFFTMVLARKTSTSHTWLAWIPIANLFQVCRIARYSMLFGIAMLVPVVNLVAAALLWQGVARVRGKQGWTGWLILIPGLNLLLPVYLASGPVTNSDAPAAADSPDMSAAAFCPECGTAIEPDQRFCGECGFDVSTLEPEPVAAAPATPSPDGSAAAPQMVMRSPMAITGILTAIAVVAFLAYAAYDSFASPKRPRQIPAMPAALAGTLTEFPIDSAEMHPLQAGSVTAQTLGGAAVRLPANALPKGVQLSTLERHGQAVTSATYRAHEQEPPISITVLHTAGDSAAAAQDIALELSMASGIEPAPIQVKTPQGQLYQGARLRNDREATYVLAKDAGPSVVIVHAADPAVLPAAERLASNVGNGDGLSAFAAVQNALGTLPAEAPADLVLQEARTLTSGELGRAEAELGEAAKSIGGDAQRIAGQVHRMLPAELVMARYQDAAKRDWAVVRGQYGSSPRALLAWTILRSLMVLTSTDAFPFGSGEARLMQFTDRKVAIFRNGAALVMLAAPADANVDHLRQLAAGAQ